MDNGRSRLITIDELVERIIITFDSNNTCDIATRNTDNIIINSKYQLSDEEKYREFTHLCRIFNQSDAVTDTQLTALISAIEEPMNYFDTLDNKRLAEAVSINFSNLYKYAVMTAKSLDNQLIISRKYYERALQCVEFAKKVKSIEHEYTSYSIAAKNAEFISKNTAKKEIKYEYALKTAAALEKAVIISEKIHTAEKIAWKYSDLGNVFQFLAKTSKKEHEIITFAEKWFDYKIKTADIYGLIIDGVLKIEKIIPIKDLYREIAYQLSYAGQAQNFLSRMKKNQQKKEHYDKAAEYNIIAGNLFVQLDMKEKAALSFVHAAENFVLISKKIDDIDTAIEYARKGYEFQIKAIQLYEFINHVSEMHFKLRDASNNALFIAENSKNFSEKREYMLIAYNNNKKAAEVMENLKHSNSNRLYEEIGVCAETIALLTDDIAQKVGFLFKANEASKKGIEATNKDNIETVGYQSLSIIKRKLYLSVLCNDVLYINETLSAIADIEINCNSFELRHRVNISFHLLEAKLTAYMLKEDYGSARDCLEQLQDYSSFKDDKLRIFELILNHLEDKELKEAKKLLSNHDDNISGNSSLNHIYKPLFLAYIERLEEKIEDRK